MITNFVAAIVLTLPSQAPETRKPRLVGVVEVGEVFLDCGHVTKAGKPSLTPAGFTISPDAAFKAAHDKVKFRCPNKFGNTIFSDQTYYYITLGPTEILLEAVKLDISPSTLNDESIRVNGHTGEI